MHLRIDKVSFSILLIGIKLFLNTDSVYAQDLSDQLEKNNEEGIFLPFPEFKEESQLQENGKSNLSKQESGNLTSTQSISSSSSTSKQKIQPDSASSSNSKTNKKDLFRATTSIEAPSSLQSNKPKSVSKSSIASPSAKINKPISKVANPEKKVVANQEITNQSKNRSNLSSLSDGSPKEDLEMDLVEYKSSLEKIRQIEPKDPDKAIQEYKSLLTKYTSTSILAEINLYIAWNYFHRNKNSESLEHIVAILDIPENLDLKEYPTALYLAGRIHERNWKGSNRDFAVRYYEIFLQNYKSGKENFKKSFYYPKVQENIKQLHSTQRI